MKQFYVTNKISKLINASLKGVNVLFERQEIAKYLSNDFVESLTNISVEEQNRLIGLVSSFFTNKKDLTWVERQNDFEKLSEEDKKTLVNFYFFLVHNEAHYKKKWIH